MLHLPCVTFTSSCPLPHVYEQSFSVHTPIHVTVQSLCYFSPFIAVHSNVRCLQSLLGGNLINVCTHRHDCSYCAALWIEQQRASEAFCDVEMLQDYLEIGHDIFYLYTSNYPFAIILIFCFLSMTSEVKVCMKDIHNFFCTLIVLIAEIGRSLFKILFLLCVWNNFMYVNFSVYSIQFNPLKLRIVYIYLRIQSVPEREHNTLPLQRSTG
jgi:hypothetical protein